MPTHFDYTLRAVWDLAVLMADNWPALLCLAVAAACLHVALKVGGDWAEQYGRRPGKPLDRD